MGTGWAVTLSTTSTSMWVMWPLTFGFGMGPGEGFCFTPKPSTLVCVDRHVHSVVSVAGSPALVCVQPWVSAEAPCGASANAHSAAPKARMEIRRLPVDGVLTTRPLYSNPGR